MVRSGYKSKHIEVKFKFQGLKEHSPARWVSTAMSSLPRGGQATLLGAVYWKMKRRIYNVICRLKYLEDPQNRSEARGSS